jgi:hypothetical protein
VVVYCTSNRFGGEGSEGGKPVFHGNNTSNRSRVISAEEKMRIQHREEVSETDPKRMPPKAAKEAMMIDHARLAVEIPSPVPPAPPAIVMSSYGVKMEDVR